MAIMEIPSKLPLPNDDALSQLTTSSRNSQPQRRCLAGIVTRICPDFISTHLDDDVRNYNYTGSGTADDPYVIDYLPRDRRNAMHFAKGRKWTIALLQSLATFVVTFASSAYASGIEGIEQHFHVSQEVAILGLSIYVMGFAVGPLLWGPLSEVCGRQFVYLISFTVYVAFNIAAPYSSSMAYLLIFRFLACAFGASSMTNAGGMIVDMFNQAERGVALGVFTAACFLGPALGPIAGGFLNENLGWRWVLGFTAILSAVVWIPTTLLTPETYAPTILRRRAKLLSRATGHVYISQLDAGKPPVTLWRELSVSLTRPWILLFHEPIILLASLYISIVYATLYSFFAGFPIIFQYTRGWSQCVAGLPFIGVAIGVCLATGLAGFDGKRYQKACAEAEKTGKQIEPELRLPLAIFGSLILPVGLFLFAWTTYPSIHWIAPIIGAVFFSCGLVVVFISLISYLVDSYTIYAASALAANTCLRSFFGAGFPLFTTQMYATLGNQWASSIPAFLALACVPFPLLFYKYGAKIRSRCKWSAESARVMELMKRHETAAEGEQVPGQGPRQGGQEIVMINV